MDSASSSGSSRSSSVDSDDFMGAAAPRDELHAGLQWAKTLYSWTCQNCTRTAPLAEFSPEILAFAAAFGARLAGWRRLAAAKRTYLAEVEAAASGVPLGSVAEGDEGTAPVDAPVRVPPVRSDFEGMEAALPPVPPPPTVPPALLAGQVCDSCDAPYVTPSGSVTLLIERDHVIEAMAAGLPIGDEDLERLGLGDGADRRRLSEWVSGAAPGPLPPGIAPVNVDLLRATLNDDDPAGFVAEVAGMTAADIADALRPAAAERAADYLPIAAQKRRGGMGGFAPVVALAYDERMLLHEEGSADGGGGGRRLTSSVPGVRLPPQPLSLHPERPDRLRAIAQHLVVTGLFQRCRRIPARDVLESELATVHTASYLEEIADLPEDVEAGRGFYRFSSDTFANAFTLRAAQLACGSVVAVTQAVARGEADRGVALVRPPGHHAEPDAALGFCLYNNVAVAAQVARKTLGVSRVLIVDWDVHHGNGTQHMFEDDPSVLYVSLHRYDHGTFYPGTGGADEVGKGAGEGYNLNIPWDSEGMGDAEYLHAFEALILPVARAFDPELVLVSAGFDAARGDPLGGCDLTPAGYAHMTHALLALARGRVVVALEGGYNLRSISQSMEAVVRVLLGESPPPLLPAGFAAAAHAPPSAESLELRGPGAAHYDEVMAMLGVSTAAAPEPAAAAAAVAEAAPGGVCAHHHHHGAGGRADAFTPTPRQLAAAARETAGLSRDAALSPLTPAASAADTIANVARTHARYWPCLRAVYRAQKRVVNERAARRLTEAQEKAAAAAAAAGDGAPHPAPLLRTLGTSDEEEEEEEEEDDDNEEGEGEGDDGGSGPGGVTDAGAAPGAAENGRGEARPGEAADGDDGDGDDGDGDDGAGEEEEGDAGEAQRGGKKRRVD